MQNHHIILQVLLIKSANQTASLVLWNPKSSTATKILCIVSTKSISRVDASNRFLTLEKEALRSKRGAESVAT